jgi:flagellar P-ring protein precursor FlgI
VAELESLSVDVDRTSKIVINERTGTIVLGKDVRISPVAILHGALSVEVRPGRSLSAKPDGAGEYRGGRAQTAVAKKARSVVLKDGARWRTGACWPRSARAARHRRILKPCVAPGLRCRTGD